MSAFRHRFFWGETLVERRFGVALLLVAIALGALLGLGGSDWREAASEQLRMTSKRFERDGRTFSSPEERERLLFKSLQREHFVKTGLWWAALVNLVLAVGLFFTRPLWCGRSMPAEAGRGDSMRGPPRPWFWMAIAAALVGAAVLRAPRLDLSLYNDEAYNVRHYIHGQYKTKADGSIRFEASTWADTFWKNKASNGVPFSALARLAAGEPPPGEIRESRLRMAAFVPGLLSIVAVALLARSLFGGMAGVAGAWWLALHPWHLRYCTEARPYGLVLLFAALALLCLLHALRHNRWPWWLGFAACEFALIWSFAGALYFVLGLNLAALFAILRRGSRWRRAALGRLAVAGVLSGMLFLQLMAPNFPQMARGLSELESLHGRVHLGLVADIVSYHATGMPVVDRDPSNPFNPALAKLLPGQWWLVLPGLLALLAVGVAAFRAFRERRESWAIGWGALLAFAIVLAASAASGGALYRWYTIYLLPFAALVFAAGWAAMWHSRRLRPASYIVILAVALLFYRPARDYIEHPKEDLRGIAAATTEGGAISAGFWTDAAIYAPFMNFVRGAEDIRELTERARREDRALHIAFAHRKLATASMPDAVALLVDSGAFDQFAEFRGLEEVQFTARVYRWNGRALSDGQAPTAEGEDPPGDGSE